MSDSQEQSRPRRQKRLPSTFYNSITLIGALIAGTAFILILFMMALEAFSKEHSPYLGIITFMILPIFLVLGLAVATIGIMRQNRRRKLGLPSTEKLLIVDFNKPVHLRAAILVGGGALVFFGLSGFGSYKAFEYSESDAFCGTTCHVVMKPEYTAFSVSPHARVGCVECHIGSGTEWFVKAKISGLKQVYAVLFDKVPRPIETPIENLRPSRDTCEQCHWPAHFYNEKLVVHDYFGTYEDNPHWRLHLLMKIGGGGEDGPAKGIHWHMNINNQIDYVATDRKRLDIPWVRATHPDGTVKIYRSVESDFTDEDLPNHEMRSMDCIDCHNRPTHHYNPPYKLVNRAMTVGRVNPDLPGIKGVLVELLSEEYETTDEALEAIDTRTREFYAEDYPEVVENMGADLDQAIVAAQRMFSTNIFPEMKVSWKEFPDHIGHLTTPGCFRCHDGLHETDDGEVLSRDCNICHSIVAQEQRTGEEVVAMGGVEYVHPEDIDGEWKVTNCSECHGE